MARFSKNKEDLSRLFGNVPYNFVDSPVTQFIPARSHRREVIENSEHELDSHRCFMSP